MKKYRTLKSVFHEQDDQAAQIEMQRRKESGYLTGMLLGENEVFYTPTTETSLLMEKIHLNEVSLSKLAQIIPGIALQSYLYALIVDEITSTNEIEGVRSTRQEILDALEAGASDNKRFKEMARLYYSLAQEEETIPHTVEELRSLYDELLEGELEEADRVDGKFFRQEIVYIKDGTGKTVHAGAPDEVVILQNVRALLTHSENNEIPVLFSSIISHFMFEATHPFYDGNGRFGRFLLSAQLKKFLSTYTVLTLSRKINEEKAKYYKAFSLVEEPKNYADATPFLISLLELIVSAQRDLIEDFEDKRRQMTQLKLRVDKLQEQESEADDALFEALFVMGQLELFGQDAAISWERLSGAIGKSKNTARRIISSLEERGLIWLTSHKPLILKLSPAGHNFLFTGVETR